MKGCARLEIIILQIILRYLFAREERTGHSPSGDYMFKQNTGVNFARINRAFRRRPTDDTLVAARTR